MPDRPSRLVSLSNVYDQTYHDLRAEPVDRCLSWGKRRDLFRCLELASNRELIVLSSPPKASQRRSFRWLAPVETRFCGHRQLFCGSWDGPKVRVPLSWFFYAWHVLNHVQPGDTVIIDNYEFIYVFAAWVVRLFRRRVTFALDYEDGKHLIDRSWLRGLSGLAEWLGRPLLRGALLAHPALGKRLPPLLPTELVPGVLPPAPPRCQGQPGPVIHLLYSGSLDRARGVDLLLETVPLLPAQGWHLTVAGGGPLREQVERFAADPKWRGRVTFSPQLPAEAYQRLLQKSHIGLNCQRLGDPISSVTFPSKLFTYFSAGLLVVSSTASNVEQICGNSCLYYRADKPEALAAVIMEAARDFAAVRARLDLPSVFAAYSEEGTVRRLREFLQKVGLPIAAPGLEKLEHEQSVAGSAQA